MEAEMENFETNDLYEAAVVRSSVQMDSVLFPQIPMSSTLR
jgi:hypothetical protein